jgi:hypothetical protein
MEGGAHCHFRYGAIGWQCQTFDSTSTPLSFAVSLSFQSKRMIDRILVAGNESGPRTSRGKTFRWRTATMLSCETVRRRSPNFQTVLIVLFLFLPSLLLGLFGLDLFIAVVGNIFIPSRRMREPNLPYGLSLVDTIDKYSPIAAE